MMQQVAESKEGWLDQRRVLGYRFSKATSQEPLQGLSSEPAGRASTYLRRRLRVCREPSVQSGMLTPQLVVGGPRQCSPDRCMHFPGGIFYYFPSTSADCSWITVAPGNLRASTGVPTQGWAHATQLLAAARKGNRSSSEVGVCGTQGWKNTRAPSRRGAGAGNVERTGKEIHPGQSSRQRRLASPSSRPAPASSSATRAGGPPSPSLLCG